MEYKTKSAIIGRKNRENETDEAYPCFISMFSINNPHTSGEVPNQTIDIPLVHKVIIKGLDVNYLLEGNDIVINNLMSITVKVEEGHVYISGVQDDECACPKG